MALGTLEFSFTVTNSVTVAVRMCALLKPVNSVEEILN